MQFYRQIPGRGSFVCILCAISGLYCEIRAVENKSVECVRALLPSRKVNETKPK